VEPSGKRVGVILISAFALMVVSYYCVITMAVAADSPRVQLQRWSFSPH